MLFNDVLRRLDNQLARMVGQQALIRTTQPIVSFTFDDVPASAQQNGAIILERSGVRGTFYIAGQLVDSVRDGTKFIDRAGLVKLAEAGHEIGCHTFSHSPLSALSRNALEQEIERNHQFLSDVTGCNPLNFAFPYNKACLRNDLILRKKFKSARAGRVGVNRGLINLYHLNAVELCQRNQLSAYDSWIDKVAAEPAWLIFFTHDVCDMPSAFGTTAAVLERVLAKALREKCQILTVNEAMNRLNLVRL